MARKSFARGEKRATVISIMRSAHVNSKTPDKTKQNVLSKIMKAVGLPKPGANSYYNFVLREGLMGRAAAASRKSAKKASAKKASRSSARRKVTKHAAPAHAEQATQS